jgi:hypothetical protein
LRKNLPDPGIDFGFVFDGKIKKADSDDTERRDKKIARFFLVRKIEKWKNMLRDTVSPA